MKKDLISAIAGGFIVGAIFALVLVNLPTLLKNTSKQANQLVNSSTPIPSSVANPIMLEISEPQDGIVAASKSIKINGKTTTGNILTIQTDNDIKTVDTSAGGNFEIPVNLVEGNNQIYITSYNDKGDQESRQLNIFYMSDTL